LLIARLRKSEIMQQLKIELCDCYTLQCVGSEREIRRNGT
jgi:hypothetical protein